MANGLPQELEYRLLVLRMVFEDPDRFTESFIKDAFDVARDQALSLKKAGFKLLDLSPPPHPGQRDIYDEFRASVIERDSCP